MPSLVIDGSLKFTGLSCRGQTDHDGVTDGMATGFGIIGCGMISHYHAQAIADLRGAKLVGCFNHTTAKARAFAVV